MILHEFLPRGQRTLIQLIRSAMVAHSMELVPLDDIAPEYVDSLEAAKRAYQSGDDIVFNALVMSVLFQTGVDAGGGD